MKLVCNFLNCSYGSQFQKRHKMAKKAHDHAGDMAQWALLPATCYFLRLWFCIVWGFAQQDMGKTNATRTKRAPWMEQTLTQALAAVKDGMSQRDAADNFKIPRRTLCNHIVWDYKEKFGQKKCYHCWAGTGPGTSHHPLQWSWYADYSTNAWTIRL